MSHNSKSILLHQLLTFSVMIELWPSPSSHNACNGQISICYTELCWQDQIMKRDMLFIFFANFKSCFEAIQKVHFIINFGADVWFVWIFFNSSAKGRKHRYSVSPFFSSFRLKLSFSLGATLLRPALNVVYMLLIGDSRIRISFHPELKFFRAKMIWASLSTKFFEFSLT